MKHALILILLAVSCYGCKQESVATQVTISGRHLQVNDEAYTIKGICYHPVPQGSEHRDFKTLSQDLVLMQEAGINTIRTYAPIDDEAVLDEIATAGLKVIIGFGYDQKGFFDVYSGSFIDYVNTYKHHPAILMWELGNEYNYHPEWFNGDVKNWYKAMNAAADLIHKNDSNHPVATAHGELPDDIALSLSPNIDVWGMNVYRWDNPEEIFRQWTAISDKPMYISEAGGDSYMTMESDGFQQGENQHAQAQANAMILDKIIENLDLCAGVTMFSFTDGWWKAGHPDQQDIGGWAPNSSGVPYDGSPNEEYWGIVDINRNKKETFTVIKAKYNQIK
ncbi:glycoside hydrolase [Formosa agariphila KMM 3901]|uniref:Glycoside hydrolase n=1 Tax=Formosa agariphila (strain DSM 15362 / KCTC 12365 / LMG 23005 / KMM 3901 / M-2Alg 35-1) TaxID=1347342 RepID=T2KM97_FORAG|nr:glycoside hydrolase family 2 TIM barrel-domain containing protein [Formosa agariphila]CDF79583.1 glycoside hydrolase [Formosa agariphila KMM 3901]